MYIGDLMKIAFAVDEDKGLNSDISRRFGRSKYFIIVDLEDNEIKNIETIDNPGSKAAGGAGIKAVQELVNRGIDVAVAGAFGPNAMTALSETGIKYIAFSDISVMEGLNRIRSELK